MKHFLVFLIAVFIFATPELSMAQDDRASTGGAQTLEDILARQRGETVDYDFRRNATGDPNSAAGIAQQLGTLGGLSDAELWRGKRFNLADITASNSGPGATTLMQDGGMWWLEFREGPLRVWGGYLLLGMLGVLVLFYLLRGKIRIEHGVSGITITRFRADERFAHWLLAGSFILLGVTGLASLFGRTLIPYVGHDVVSPVLIGSKWIHNNVSWAFIMGLVLVFLFWVKHNLPSRVDLAWMAKGGGLFTKGVHPPAKKFNAGQKLIFWSVIVLGASISASGLSLLFPFEMPMFASTFAKLNAWGISDLLGLGTLPEVLTDQEEMQYAQLWHAIVSFVLMAIIIAHIYLGSVGMEGAYDAMGSGEVDLNWAKEHHSLWVDEEQSKGKTAPPDATPAE